MSVHIVKTKKIGIVIVLCILIQFYVIAIPLVYSKNSDYLPRTERDHKNRDFLYHSLGETSVLRGLSETEALKNLEIKLLSDRRLNDLYKFIHWFLVASTLSYIVQKILLSFLISVIHRPICKSVLALSIGGHAPPTKRFSLYYILQKGKKE